MSQPKCLITGCRLVIPELGQHVWGDLHRAGQAVIFNAALLGGEAAWEYNNDWEKVEDTERQIHLSPLFPLFERRGVLVFDLVYLRCNRVAEEFLRKWS